jgi:hypothetical protein
MQQFYCHFENSWVRKRRAVYEAMSRKRTVDYYPIHLREALLLTDGLLKQPHKWEDEIHRCVDSYGKLFFRA